MKYSVFNIHNWFVDNTQWYHLCDTWKSATETFLIRFTKKKRKKGEVNNQA